MKPIKLFAVLAFAAATVAAPIPAAQATALTVGGPWTVIDQNPMVAGDFFKAPDGGIIWTVDCTTSHCKLFVTDLFVITDQFAVYIDGALAGNTPNLPDWDALGLPGPFAPPYTTDPDVAWATPEFSKGIFLLATGAHTISIQDIHIPPVSAGGNPFADGTVAFRVTVPEPGTLALLGVALAGLGFSRRKVS